MPLTSFLQESLIATMCYVEKEGKFVRGLLEANQYDPYYKDFASVLHEYIDKYKCVPSSHTLDLVETLKARDPQKAKVYDQIFDSILNIRTTLKLEYVLNDATLFARRQALKATNIAVLEKLEEGETEEATAAAEAIMNKGKNRTAELFDPGIPGNDPEKSLRFLETADEDQIKIGIRELDKYGIVPTKKRLWMLMALYGRGKTWCCTHILKKAVMQHQPTVYISAEQTADDISSRAMATLFSISKRREGINYVQFTTDELDRYVSQEMMEIESRPARSDPDIREHLTKEIRARAIGRDYPPYFIKHFTPGTLTVDGINSYLDGLEHMHNFSPSCIAEGSLVLTERGLIPIEKIQGNDRLWDGENWVSHDGLIYKGIQDVITYAGITGTPDHQIWTETGWRALIDCKQLGLRVAQTGVGRQAIRVGKNYITDSEGTQIGERVLREFCSDSMRSVWQTKMDAIGQPAIRNCEGLSNLYATETICQVDVPEICNCATTLHQSEVPILEGLWGQGNQIQFSFGVGSGFVGDGEFGIRRGDSAFANRPNQQRWSLRAGEFTSFNPQAELLPHAAKPLYQQSAFIPTDLSSCEIRNEHSVRIFDQTKNDSGRDFEAVGKTTQRKVYDIANAGPLHRFTVQGILVKNCIILDYIGKLKIDPKYERQMIENYATQFRGIGIERNAAMVSPTQANREAEHTTRIRGGQTGLAFGLPQIADFFITYNQTDAEAEQGLARLWVDKGRDDHSRFEVLISQSYAMGQFCMSSAMMNKRTYWEDMKEAHEDSARGEEHADHKNNKPARRREKI